jgi:hypothetical protein
MHWSEALEGGYPLYNGYVLEINVLGIKEERSEEWKV